MRLQLKSLLASFSSKRLSLLFNFVKSYLVVSFFFRIILFIWEYSEVSWNIFSFLRTVFTGLFFDIGTCTFIITPSVLYLLLIPNRFIGSIVDKVFVNFIFTLTIFILVFTFFAEITFWEEFGTRFNFIAVDYLIYTHEVIQNIEESYPLPLLISGVAFVTFIVLFYFHKKQFFSTTFSGKFSLKQRITLLIPIALLLFLYISEVTNNQAEWGTNRYNNEISKSGIYSFFAEFRSNQMQYEKFYTTIENKEAFSYVKKHLSKDNSQFLNPDDFTIRRNIKDTLASEALKPNVVFILVESLSASFMNEFGSKENITPFLDSLAQKSLFFSNLYATGTRTVRGMEAVTLSIPPTPGQSIVKRLDNQNLFTISTIFKAKNYDCNFFYGGDGYFDNMNSYFGGNGFNIYDRGRGSVLNDNIKMQRNNITNNEVTFENAWGICDEDIFNKLILVSDEQYKANKPFLNFVMTTSNHRPYTYSENKISIPSGTGRSGAVAYTDFALKELFETAKNKPWFKNTVFVIIADHCASSAGKDEINVTNYHIPAFIVNLSSYNNRKVMKQCSQIDIFPTLFSLLHWDYETNLFGENILNINFEERAFVATYRKLSLLKQDKIMILSDQKKQAFYKWNRTDNSLKPLPIDTNFLNETISWYQTADYLYTNKLLKE